MVERQENRRVAICIITFRRPAGLRRLIEAIGRLELSQPVPAVEVVVVDNDQTGSARAVCTAMAGSYRWPLHYEVEPRRGIPFARNRAIASVVNRVDSLAFIDDDTVPRPDWLDTLLAVADAHDADVVTGPWVRRYAADAPRWVTRGRWFQSPHHATGRRLARAVTNNVLVRTPVFRQMDRWFDERIGLGGGSDTEFFRRVHLAGHTIVWAEEAVVEEWTPARRLTAKWILLRAYSQGNATALLEMQLGGRWSDRAALLGRAAAFALRGVALLPLVLVLGKCGLVRSLWYVCRAAGIVSGLTGRRFAYYRGTVHADT